MSRIEILKEKVMTLYQAKDPNRADWEEMKFEMKLSKIIKG